MTDKNPFPGENNTGHIWDDNLRELKNPPPNWWMTAFWVSVVWWIGYGIIYPMWPLANDYTRGVTGWTSIGEYKAALAEVEKIRAPYEQKIAGLTAKEILADDDLTKYVEASGKVLFGDNCSACHGNGGQGNVGYPVLADDDWLFGGTIEQIEQSITLGRKGVMTGHGASLSAEEIDQLAKYTVTLSEGGTDEAGAQLFQAKACFACHGMDGKGMAALGSANLTDGIWRFEPGGYESAKYTITHGVNFAGDDKTRNAEMPSFKDKLTADEIKKMAVYVYKFGGGK